MSDDQQFPNVLIDFRTMVVTRDAYVEGFYAWFNTEFVPFYVDAALDFELIFNKDHEGTEVLEIVSMNTGFSVDSLFEMYRQFKAKTTKVVVPFRKELDFVEPV